TERRSWVRGVEQDFAELCRAIGEPGQLRVRYATPLVPGDDVADALASALADRRAQDARRGVTHVGPHRDDLELTLDGRELRTFGSAGQQRTAAIALRLLEAATFRDRAGRAPLFLLDDPFAELDLRRAARVLDLLERGRLC